jgi:PTS system galactitol-specific IIA component
MISDFLRPEAIALHLAVRSSQEVIEILGARLLALGSVKPDFVAATLKREADMPTGLALGGTINAAIPHVDCEYVNQPALALGTLQSPVIFHDMVEAEVEVPVQLVIMLALDQPKSQIEMLQSVSGLLQQPALIQALMTAQRPEEALAVLARAETEP